MNIALKYCNSWASCYFFMQFMYLLSTCNTDHVHYWCMFNEGLHRHANHMHSDVIHVATTSPVCLYSMDTSRQHLSCIDLYDVFPGSASRFQSSHRQPRFHLAPLAYPLDANIIMHDELVCVCIVYNVILLLFLCTFKYCQVLCSFVANRFAVEFMLMLL